MKKILLDTNMLIYREDNKIFQTQLAELTRNLYDSSEYKIVVHPKSIEEAKKNRNEEQRNIFVSKLRAYPQITNPPKATDKFIAIVGTNNGNDDIDNELLYAVKQNCVDYLITNDMKLKSKSKKVNLSAKVLTIDEAVKKFALEEDFISENPPFIEERYLYELDVEEPFFDSLRDDYKGFDKWFEKKQRQGEKAYIIRKNKKITAFLMLKEENESEAYNEFEKPLPPAKRLKVSTLKVDDKGKKIGETFIKIMIKKAFEKDVDEIYVTVFQKQEELIYLLKEYGFYEYTYKVTVRADDTEEKELIYVKNMRDKTQFPFVTVGEQNIILLPIKPKYHRLLFLEAEKEPQLTIDDMQGSCSSANAIRKVYVTNSNLKSFENGDILLFYASEEKKAITTVGVVDYSFISEDIEKAKTLIKRRTAYTEMELREVLKNTSRVIMFKHAITFENPVSYEALLENDIVKDAIQCATTINKEKFLRFLLLCGKDKNMFNVM